MGQVIKSSLTISLKYRPFRIIALQKQEACRAMKWLKIMEGPKRMAPMAAALR